MINQFFGMKANPFEKDVAVGDMFEGEDIRELDSRLKYMMSCRGIFLLIGEPGSGKTAALRKFMSQLGPSLYKPLYLPLTTLTVSDFYRGITSLLGETPRFRKIDMFGQIQSAISALYHDQRITPVFLFDEIHMASTAILEDLRMLFNFNMDSSNPFIIILAGQPAIRSKLSLNTCLPIRQRISSKYSMKGLSLYETSEYINTRMALAGITRAVFTERAVSNIHSLSKGFPRNINNIATNALLYCTSKKLEMADEEAILQADLELAY